MRFPKFLGGVADHGHIAWLAKMSACKHVTVIMCVVVRDNTGSNSGHGTIFVIGVGL